MTIAKRFPVATASLRTLTVGCALAVAVSLAGCGDGGTPTARIAEPQPVGGPPLVRRLTESQYRATIADIFDSDIPVVGRFERGVRTEGLIAVGTSVVGFSPFGMEQYHATARGIADAVFSEEHRDELVPCSTSGEQSEGAQSSGQSFDEACAQRFVEHYGPLLFRRPMDQDEVASYVSLARQGYELVGDFYGGLSHMLAGMLVAPEFLHRIERVDTSPSDSESLQLDPYSKAARLSFFLTNSTPDAELLRAAGSGELDTKQGLERQVDRLMASPRFEQALRAFFADMLEFDLFEDLTKDSQIYPAFNSDVVADAQEQTLRTITHHLMEKGGDYRDLFTTRETFLTRSLGVVYRVPVQARTGWEKVEFDEDSYRAGIQSHISFLALHSHPGRSSPTLRGKALREVFLCQIVPDPPADVDFTAVEAEGAEVAFPTARDRLNRHNTDPACTGCHLITDPPALTLERFDGVGAYRTHENGVLIDTHGGLDGVEFDTSDGLAQTLRDHSETPRCLVEKMYRYAVGRDTMWDERAYMDYLMKNFSSRGYQVPALMRTIALSDNFFTINLPEYSSGSQYTRVDHHQEDQL